MVMSDIILNITWYWYIITIVTSVYLGYGIYIGGYHNHKSYQTGFTTHINNFDVFDRILIMIFWPFIYGLR